MHKLSLKEFVLKANVIHANKYDYSKVVSCRWKDKICISCPKHGDFIQWVCSHLRGSGCKKCSIERFKRTKKDFINMSKSLFRNSFDYSFVEDFKNNKTDILLICNTCGALFYTNYNRHISKRVGCLNCSHINIEFRTRQERSKEFMRRAHEIHGDRYTYDNCHYIHAFKKIKVTCDYSLD
jgi:hypothetical protein